MFYSRSIDEAKIDLFLSLISRIINGEVVKEKIFIDSILQDVHDLAVGTKNFYELNRDGYPVSMYLYDGDKEFFKNLTPDSISTDDYKKVLNILQKHMLVTA